MFQAMGELRKYGYSIYFLERKCVISFAATWFILQEYTLFCQIKTLTHEVILSSLICCIIVILAGFIVGEQLWITTNITESVPA